MKPWQVAVVDCRFGIGRIQGLRPPQLAHESEHDVKDRGFDINDPSHLLDRGHIT